MCSSVQVSTVIKLSSVTMTWWGTSSASAVFIGASYASWATMLPQAARRTKSFSLINRSCKSLSPWRLLSRVELVPAAKQFGRRCTAAITWSATVALGSAGGVAMCMDRIMVVYVARSIFPLRRLRFLPSQLRISPKIESMPLTWAWSSETTSWGPITGKWMQLRNGSCQLTKNGASHWIERYTQTFFQTERGHRIQEVIRRAVDLCFEGRTYLINAVLRKENKDPRHQKRIGNIYSLLMEFSEDVRTVSVGKDWETCLESVKRNTNYLLVQLKSVGFSNYQWINELIKVTGVLKIMLQYCFGFW